MAVQKCVAMQPGVIYDSPDDQQIQIQYKYKSFIATTDGYITIEY